MFDLVPVVSLRNNPFFVDCMPDAVFKQSCMIGLVHCVQLPRLYNVYKEQGIIENFEQLLDNIFHPLFEVTRDPNSHPQLHLFLKNVSSALVLLQCLWCLGPCSLCWLLCVSLLTDSAQFISPP